MFNPKIHKGGERLKFPELQRVGIALAPLSSPHTSLFPLPAAEDRKRCQRGRGAAIRGQLRPRESPLSLSLVKAAAADSDSFTQLRD